MSLFETAFVSSLTVFIFSFYINRGKRYRWIAILLSLSLVLFATHTLTEGYRWQMFPAYLFFFVMAMMSLIVFQELFPSDLDKNKKPSNMPVNIFIRAVLLLMLAASWIVPIRCRPSSQEYIHTRLYSLPELAEDFEVLKTTLMEAHGNLYAQIDPSDFELAAREVLAGLDTPLTETEFYRIVSPLVSAVRCGHTHILPSRGYEAFLDQKTYCLPYDLVLFENKLFIYDEIFPGKKIVKGSEILSVNGRESQWIIGAIIHNLSGDGVILSQRRRKIGRNFCDYYARYIEHTEEFSLRIKRLDGRIEEVEPQTLTRNRYQKSMSAKTSEAADPLVAFELRLDLDTALLRMKTFYTVDLKKEGVRYKKSFRSLFSRIEENGIQNLILDIRGNAGGSLKLASELLSYLMDREFRFLEEYRLSPELKLTHSRHIDRDLFITFKWLVTRKMEDRRNFTWHRLLNPVEPQKRFQFKGNVYVLIDGETFSAASMFASHLRSRSNTIFVGEETGGTACGNGVSPIHLTLPNTRLRVQIPFGYVRLAVPERRDCSRGIIPDYIVQEKPDDRSAGRDQALDCVFGLISSGQSRQSPNC